jgi:hypothetical protein
MSEYLALKAFLHQGFIVEFSFLRDCRSRDFWASTAGQSRKLFLLFIFGTGIDSKANSLLRIPFTVLPEDFRHIHFEIAV